MFPTQQGCTTIRHTWNMFMTQQVCATDTRGTCSQYNKSAQQTHMEHVYNTTSLHNGHAWNMFTTQQVCTTDTHGTCLQHNKSAQQSDTRGTCSQCNNTGQNPKPLSTQLPVLWYSYILGSSPDDAPKHPLLPIFLLQYSDFSQTFQTILLKI